MSKPIIMSEKAWGKLHQRLARDYPASVIIMREKMKRVLGFTVRLHREYEELRGSLRCIHLDFYDEPKRTMFLLKYGEYLDADRT